MAARGRKNGSCGASRRSRGDAGCAAGARTALLAVTAMLVWHGGWAVAQPPAGMPALEQGRGPSADLHGGSLQTLRITPRARQEGSGEKRERGERRPAEEAGVPGRVLVAFRESISREEKELILSRVAAGARLAEQRHSRHFDVVEIDGPAAARAEVLRALTADPRVRVAEEDAAVRVHGRIPNDPQFGMQWACRNTGQGICYAEATHCSKNGADIHATDAWEVTTGSSDVVVAVIDTGVDYNHPDLAANILRDANGKVAGYDFVNDDEDPMDDHGHGTHCAGIIGAVGDNRIGIAGVAWTVRILPVKAMNASGEGRLSDVIAAVDYAVEHGARILNASFGSWAESQLLLDAVRRAEARGVLLVASAGNGGNRLEDIFVYPAMYAQEVSNVVSVAASDFNDNLSPLSNYGREYCDVAAPGFYVLSTVPLGTCAMCNSSGYATASGTSMAAAVVSGAAALIQARFPGADVHQVRARLLYTSDVTEGIEGYVRYGRLNAWRALAEDHAAPAAPAELTVAGSTSRSLRLKWKAPGDNGGREKVSDYLLTYREASGTEAPRQIRLGLRPGAPGTEESRDLTGLNPDTEYMLELRAVDAVGNVSPAVELGRVRTAHAELFDGAESRPIGRLDGDQPWEVVDQNCHTGERCFASPAAQAGGTRASFTWAEDLKLAAPACLSLRARLDFPLNYGLLAAIVELPETRQVFYYDFPWRTRSWSLYRIDLSPFQGKTVAIRFSVYRGWDQEDLKFGRAWIDDVAITPLDPVWQDDVEGPAQFSGLPPWTVTAEESSSPRQSWTDSPGSLYRNGLMAPLVQDASVTEAERYGSLLLRFRAKLDLEMNLDYLEVYATADGGKNWRYLASLTGTSPWRDYSYWLPDGWRQVQVLFLLVTNGGGRQDGVYVDDIGIWGEPIQSGAGDAGQTRLRTAAQSAAGRR